MEKYFSIGETAKINNVSIQALRLYDKMGLLKPSYVDPISNYRYYTIDQFVYLDLIKYSKQIGAPLKEVSDILHTNDISTLQVFLKKQHKFVEEEMIRLKNISKGIEHIEKEIKYALEFDKRNEVYFRDIKKRFIVNTLLSNKEKDSDIELKLRKLDKIVEENKIMLGGETGYYIYMDAFLDDGKVLYKSLYSTLCVDGKDNNNFDINEIPEGRFLCVAYKKNERKNSVAKLRKYINDNNITTIGIGVEIQLFNTLEQWQNNKLIYELQILI
ncbi:helix-turn-helix domain-containing protein [Mycoplasmatota bacterium WC44]